MQRLGELGVQLHAHAPGAEGPCNGVVMFNGSAAAAAASIQAVAGGAERVLALSACAEPLGEDSWGLLRAGASDACSWADPASAARLVAERLRRWQTIDELVGSPR